MAEADRSLVGRTGEMFTFPIEAGKIHEFATAIHDPNPIFHSKEAAVQAGFENIPAPLTYTAVSAHFRKTDIIYELGLDLRRLLHAESEWEYLVPVVAGDVLHGQQKVVDSYQKQGRRSGLMEFFVIETIYTNQRGEAAIRHRDTLVMTQQTVGAQEESTHA